jgi:hypothetical protein
MARAHALDFGRSRPSSPPTTTPSRADSASPNSHERPHLLHTSTDSVVVVTTASEDIDSANPSVEVKERVRTEPRGFFADQFEVRYPLPPDLAPYSNSLLPSSAYFRTDPTTKRTSPPPDLRFGVRPLDQCMGLSRAQDLVALLRVSDATSRRWTKILSSHYQIQRAAAH